MIARGQMTYVIRMSRQAELSIELITAASKVGFAKLRPKKFNIILAESHNHAVLPHGAHNDSSKCNMVASILPDMLIQPVFLSRSLQPLLNEHLGIL
jgi:hypothetical protein